MSGKSFMIKGRAAAAADITGVTGTRRVVVPGRASRSGAGWPSLTVKDTYQRCVVLVTAAGKTRERPPAIRPASFAVDS